ncbi:hypothetical protein HMPREF1145_1487 [Oribacterium parvum ACB8]|nr:hypothetical protein HMPREF1145_1487 [Oribacterium parvum ACB8]
MSGTERNEKFPENACGKCARKPYKCMEIPVKALQGKK